MSVYLFLCVYTCVRARGGHPLSVFNNCSSRYLHFLRWGPQWTGSLLTWLGCLTSKAELQGSSPCFPSAENTALALITFPGLCPCGPGDLNSDGPAYMASTLLIYPSLQSPLFPWTHFLGGNTNLPCDMTAVLFSAWQLWLISTRQAQN